MFGWFPPQCPVDPEAKQWLESQLLWLSEQFGLPLFAKRPILLPTREFFPTRIDGSEASLRELLDQVCDYMDVDPAMIHLNLFHQKGSVSLVNEEGRYLPTGPSGLYEYRGDKVVIHIETSFANDLQGLVSTMAHELAHYRLMGEQRVMGNEFDNELLTDLTAVYFGFGIFLGNNPRNWDGQYGLWPGSSLRRPEYMTLPMYAYALAHAALWRNERKPSWMRHLSFEMKPCFKQAIRYLWETGDSQFTPSHLA